MCHQCSHHGYRGADLPLCFRICNVGFLKTPITRPSLVIQIVIQIRANTEIGLDPYNSSEIFVLCLKSQSTTFQLC